MSYADTVNVLDEVIVTATRTDETFITVPGLIKVITSSEIRDSGAIHLVDVLRRVGGIQISDLFGDGSRASVGLRGFSETAQQNTLIMVDGRRLNNADNGLPDLNTVSLDNIERIEIITGSAGTLYGDKAVGGVINIVTRSPRKKRFQVGTSIGSYNSRRFFASVEERLENGLGFRIGATRRLSDNYRDNNDLRLTDGLAKIDFEHDTGNLFVEYEDVNESLELPGPLFRDQLAADRRQALNPDDFIDTDTRASRLGFVQSFGPYLEGRFEYTNRLSEADGQLSSSGFPSPVLLKRHHIEYTPRLIGTLPLPAGRSLITLGADIFKTDYFLQSNFGLTDDTQTQESVYLRGILPLTDSVDMTVGGRYGEVSNDILVDTLCCGRSLPEGTEIDDKATAYELGFAYRMVPSLRLFARFDRNYRFVTADEFSAIADNNFFGLPFVPFPETQTGYSYELGMQWREGLSALDILIYQLDLSDEIVFDPTFGVNTSIGDTRRRGIVIDGQYPLLERLLFSAYYSFIDSEIMSGQFSGSELTFIAEHTARLALDYELSSGFSSNLAVTGLSERVFGGDFNNEFSSLPGYVIANMALTYNRGGFQMSFQINNLLDKEYSDSGSIGFDFRQGFPSPRVETFFPAPERNVFITVSYTYP